MNITASMVKELRTRTGSGMMECKKALQEANGDIELAVEALRKSGKAKVDKKAGRTVREGVVAQRLSNDQKQGVIVEVNSETDFVARDENFVAFVDKIVQIALDIKAENPKALLDAPFSDGSGQSVEQARQELVGKVGENVEVRRVCFLESDMPLGSYMHGARIAVLVSLDTDNETVRKDIAMHIAASKPLTISSDEISQEMIDKEKEIFTAQVQESGKPQEIIEKMVSGRLQKFMNEVSLLGQPFVKQPDLSVENFLKENRTKVLAFKRVEVGEGIEKSSENFAEEVMSQVQSSS